MARVKFHPVILAATLFCSAELTPAADVTPLPTPLSTTPVSRTPVSGTTAIPSHSPTPAPSADDQDAYVQAANTLSLAPTYASDAAVPIRRAPLMDALNRVGLARPLENAGINIYGVIDGSFGYNFNDPHPFEKGNPSHKVELRMYDHHSNQFILQRVDLFVDRVVNYHHATQLDVGGLAELQYGHDGAMMHSNGLADYRRDTSSSTGFTSEHNPYYQFDPTELYADLALPVGNGARIRAGKFATIMGYESCDPIHNQAVQFFSRSYILTFGIPMYQTGAYATYDITDDVTANLGFSRGWEQSLKDNNSSLDFLGSVNFILNDHFTDYVALSEGPEEPGDDAHYRTVLEDIIYFTPNPRGPWNFALDALLGFEDDQTTQYFSFNPGARTSAAPGHVSWSGVALFGGYRISNSLQLKARAEWFQDNGGTRFRFPEANTEFTATTMADTAVQIGQNYNAYEFTIGADWFPAPHYLPTLKLRPELRYDYVDKRILVLDKNGNGRHDQTTFGLDLLYRF